jgi:hypothetical protein
MITAHAGKFTELLSRLGIYGIELTERFKMATKIPTPDGLVLDCTYAALKGETLKAYGTFMQTSNGTFRWQI